MNIVEIQTKLGELGLLDPPSDGQWGGVSRWALGQAIGGTVQDEAITSLAVETALKAAQPLPLTPGDDLAGHIIKTYQAKGYWVSRHPACYNVGVVEGTDLDGSGNGDPPNQFKALRYAINVVGGVPKMAGKWIATTEPSKYWTENPMNDLGAARVVPGQYKAWVKGSYHGAEAWVQAGELAVQRDLKKTYKRYGTIYRGSNYGIHHHQDYNYPRNDQGRSSAGCWVTWQISDHEQYMRLTSNDARYKASHGYKLLGTLLLHSDLGSSPIPPITPPHTDAISRRCRNVWMTRFADLPGDPENSAYTGKLIDPNVIGFSVSDRFDQPRPWVRAFYGNHVCEGPLVDVGPGFTNDPWWNDPNGQPRANNGAGLDATPAAWRALGLDPGIGKIHVDFELFDPHKSAKRLGATMAAADNWKPRE